MSIARASALRRITLSAVIAALAACGPQPAPQSVTRHPIPNSSFPIARAVEVPAGKTLIFHSGLTPDPAQPGAEKFSPEYWGDTQAQTVSTLSKIKGSLESMGLSMADVIKMNAYLVAPPSATSMDFAGFMAGYTQFFGTPEQPALPARTTVQIAGLAAAGMLVEIEVVVARP